MSFDEELKKLIADARAETARTNQEVLNFRNEWQRVKLNIVKPVLDQGANALRIHAQMEAATELKNGSIRLSVGRKSRNTFTEINALVFSPNESKLEVECSYKGAVAESFTLDSVNTPIVQGKVKEFISAVLERF